MTLKEQLISVGSLVEVIYLEGWRASRNAFVIAEGLILHAQVNHEDPALGELVAQRIITWSELESADFLMAPVVFNELVDVLEERIGLHLAEPKGSA